MHFFKILHQSRRSKARVGIITTPHGSFYTPGFVPVGTNGSLKAIDMVTTNGLNVDLLFCNTYHLMVQPGADRIAQAGGIHTFTGRTGPIITDSGGFQVFSLAYGNVASELKSKGQKNQSSSVLKVSEDGVLFRSYKDGSPIMLTPELSIQAQKKIGADMIVSFDELLPYHTTPALLKKSFERTHRWEERSLEEHLRSPYAVATGHRQYLYSVIHGGTDPELRKKSALFLADRAFDGMAVGGSVGKNREEMVTMLQGLMPYLPEDRPRHLLGIGDIPSLEQVIPLGIDTLDSAHPTKIARHGLCIIADPEKRSGSHQGVLGSAGGVTRRILASGNATDFGPIEEGCGCFTCQHYSVAYLHHLFKAHEPVVLTLASLHNVVAMMRVMERVRGMIYEDKV